METFSLIIEIIIVGLLIVLVITIFKYPMDIIRGFLILIEPDWFRPITWIFSPIWLIAYGLNKKFNLKIIDSESNRENLSEEPYPSHKNLKVDFKIGVKALYVNSDESKIIEHLKEFLEFAEKDYHINEFKFNKDKLVECPSDISFYDFNILTQHFCNEFKNAKGLFKSDKFGYYLYQDSKTTHNLIGKTTFNQKFSIYTLDDLDNKIYLKLNNEIKVLDFKYNENKKSSR
jgi:hypothetical protein